MRIYSICELNNGKRDWIIKFSFELIDHEKKIATVDFYIRITRGRPSLHYDWK